MSGLSVQGACVPVDGNLALWLRSAVAVEHKIGKRGVAMPEQTITASKGRTNPPFRFASVRLEANKTSDPNVTVTVEGLGGGLLRQAFLQVQQDPDAERPYPDDFSLQVIELGDDFLVFRIRRVDAKTGWHQELKVQMLLILERER
jgi:hypothetical protein